MRLEAPHPQVRGSLLLQRPARLGALPTGPHPPPLQPARSNWTLAPPPHKPSPPIRASQTLHTKRGTRTDLWRNTTVANRSWTIGLGRAPFPISCAFERSLHSSRTDGWESLQGPTFSARVFSVPFPPLQEISGDSCAGLPPQ